MSSNLRSPYHEKRLARGGEVVGRKTELSNRVGGNDAVGELVDLFPGFVEDALVGRRDAVLLVCPHTEHVGHRVDLARR